MPSVSAMYLLYTYALQRIYIFVSRPVDQEANISEQMKDPVTY